MLLVAPNQADAGVEFDLYVTVEMDTKADNKSIDFSGMFSAFASGHNGTNQRVNRYRAGKKSHGSIRWCGLNVVVVSDVHRRIDYDKHRLNAE